MNSSFFENVFYILFGIIMAVIQVADFGLAKLTEVGNTSLPTRGIVGTFGYMPPE
jgi:serine/threonine protein kinase